MRQALSAPLPALVPSTPLLAQEKSNYNNDLNAIFESEREPGLRASPLDVLEASVRRRIEARS
jgi:hypothetical protein